MKYWQPYGITDPDAPYINGDPSIGRQGSIPPAGSIEQDQREIVNTILGAGMNPTETDVQQLLVAVRSQRMNYAVDTNSLENTLEVVFLPPIANTMTPGMPLRIKPLTSNTDACTLIVDNVSSPLRRANGSELVEGDIINGIPFECIWNDGGYWAMTNYHGLPGAGPPPPPNQVITKIPYTVDVGTSGHIIANFSPAITSPVPGDQIEVKLTHNIVGATGIVINGLPEVAVVRPNGSAMQLGDGVSGQVALMFRSDAGNWQFTGVIPQTFAGFGVPIGSIIITLGPTAPSGSLKLNGAMLNRTEHPGLWAFAQASTRICEEFEWQNAANRFWTSFSRGDGTTTFRLPDFRGEFLRWWDDARGIDPGRLLKTQQADVVGVINLSGTVDLVNPKLTMGPYPPYPGPPTPSDPFDRNMELVSRKGALTGHNEEVSGLIVNVYDDPRYGYPTWMYGGGVAMVAGTETMWVVASSPAYGGPSHIDSRISSAFSVGGSGGGNETRPRNLALVPCIVDG